MCGRALKSTTCAPPQPQPPARNLKRSLPLPVNRWRQHGARSQHHHRLCLGLQLHLLSPRTTRSAPVSAPAHGLSIAPGRAGGGPPRSALLCPALLLRRQQSAADSDRVQQLAKTAPRHHQPPPPSPPQTNQAFVLCCHPPPSKDITWRPP